MDSGQKDQLTLRAFRCVDEPRLCAEFAREHLKVLEDFGITIVSSVDNSWSEDPNVYAIVAEHAQLGFVGGIKIHIARSPEDSLPIVGSVGKLDPKVKDLVTRLSANGVGEICGLWNAMRYAGRGVPHILGMAAVSMANQFNVMNMIGVLARYTLRYSLRLGLPVITEVGDKGWFVYPKPGFWGIVTGTTDAYSLDLARTDLRHRMISLRLRPEQRCIEDSGTHLLDIQYKLRLDQNVIDLQTYNAIQENRLLFTA